MKIYKNVFPLLILLLLLTSGRASAQDKNLPLNWYKNYNVKYYKIDIEASDTNTFIKGSSTLYCTVNVNFDTLFLEMGNHLIVDSIFCNAQKVKYTHIDKLLSISIDHPFKTGSSISTSVYYHGLVPSDDFFSALTTRKDSKWQIPVTWTLSESFAAKNWFPCKQDLLDKADSAIVFITVPSTCKAGSNGLLTAITPMPHNKMRYEWKTHYPIAYYLISFAVANYQDYSFYVKLSDKDSLLMQNYIYNNPDYLTQNKALIDKIGPVLNYYSSIFGIYPFIKEKYGHCLAPIYGGMENQTMTTLLNFDFSLFTHEMAHQWFGDYVTCSTWQDIWLNEGFASYAEYLSLDKFESHEAAQKWMNTAHFSALHDSTGTIFVPKNMLSNELRIFSSSLTYKKGAALIHQLRYEINNDSLFFSILRSYLSTYKYSMASCKDFINITNKLTNIDFTDYFDQWYYGSGFPIFDVTWNQHHNELNISIHEKSSGNAKNLFKMHMDVKINYEKGSDSSRIFIDKETTTLKFSVKKKVKSITLDPENWYLKRIEYFQTDKNINIDNKTEIVKLGR